MKITLDTSKMTLEQKQELASLLESLCDPNFDFLMDEIYTEDLEIEKES